MKNQEMSDTKPEDIGRMGEGFFISLCKNFGFVANSSESDDKGGWDFEVEHRRSNKIDYSNQSYPVYRVQVKSTATPKNQTKLTYSNLLKLIQYNGPSFIVLIKYSKPITPNPDAAFIFHVDETFSKTILKEIRKKQVQLKKFALNKNEKTIKFCPENEIKPLTGPGLKMAFDIYTGPDHLKYVDKKLKCLSKLEKNGRTKLYNVTLKSKKDITAMANCFLGFKERFNMDVAEYSAPFGIKDKYTISTFKDHNTTISPQHKKLPQTKICFKTSKYGRQYEFVGTSYIVPQQLQGFASKMVRIKCKLFDCLFDYNERRISIQSINIFTDDLIIEFKELYIFFCFLNDSRNSNETYIKLVDLDSNKSVEVRLGGPMFEVDDTFQMNYETISSTYKKLCDLNLENSSISTRYLWDKIGSFRLFSIMDQEFDPELVVPFKSQGKVKPDTDVVIFHSTIEINKMYLVTFVAFYGLVARVNEKELRGSFKKSEFIDEYLLNSEDNLEEFIKTKSKYYESTFLKKGFKVLD
jgi:hypothetical protein